MLTQEQIERMYQEMELKSRKDIFVSMGMDEETARILECVEKAAESLEVFERAEKLKELPSTTPPKTDSKTFFAPDTVEDIYGKLARSAPGDNPVR